MKRSFLFLLVSLISFSMTTGCMDSCGRNDSGTSKDAGELPGDAATPPATTDAGIDDAGMPDAGVSVSDGGVIPQDGGNSDAGITDPVSPDAGVNDAGVAADAHQMVDGGDSEDLLPPNWPASAMIQIESKGRYSVRLRWPPADDDIGIVRYEVRKDNELAFTTDGNTVSGTVDSLSPMQQVLLSVRAIDGANRETSDLVLSVTTLPEDTPSPETIAPPPSRVEVETFDEEVAFLYKGPEAIQRNVEPEAIEPERSAVIRGRVMTREEAPIDDVQVTVLNHPELGYTTTRSDGYFDLVANGGDVVTVTFQKDGFLPVQRSIKPTYHQYVSSDPVVMIGVDGTATVVDLTTDAVQVAQGSEVIDDSGQRKATLLFLPGTVATYVNHAGEHVDMNTLSVRVTEYTVGDNGPETMPGALPATSAYTYAAELSVDEVLQNGVKVEGRDVVFTQSETGAPATVPFYLDNFIGMNVGSIVPYGYYNNDRGAWVPGNDGIVLQVLGDINDDGLAELDLDGDGAGDEGGYLELFSITDAERQKIAELFSAGTTLWRVGLNHFSTIDCNFGLSDPDGASSPDNGRPRGGNRGDGNNNGGDDPCGETGCFIDVLEQRLLEQVAIPDTPFHLIYDSAQQANGAALEIPLTGDDVPEPMLGGTLHVRAAGVRQSHEFEAIPGQTFLYEWDGIDSFGRKTAHAVSAEIEICWTYPRVYRVDDLDEDYAAEVVRQFGLPNGDGIVPRPDRTSSSCQTYEELMGRDLVGTEEWGGFRFSHQHRYNPETGELSLGNGTRRWATSLGLTVQNLTSQEIGETVSADSGISIAPDGTLYALSSRYVKRKNPETGVFDIVAGTDSDGGRDPFYDGQNQLFPGSPGYVACTKNEDCSGEEVCWQDQGRCSRPSWLATELNFGYPEDIAFDPLGRWSYCVATSSDFVYCVRPDGTVDPYLYHPNEIDSFVDGSHRHETYLEEVIALEFAPDGTLYVLDNAYQAERILQVGLDDRVRRFAGGKHNTNTDDGINARDFNLYPSPTDLAMCPNGNLFVSFRNGMIHKIGPSGTIERWAGNTSASARNNEGPARDAKINTPWSIACDSQNNLFLTDPGDAAIRYVDESGVIHRAVGTGSAHRFSDGAPPSGNMALQTPLSSQMRSVSIGPDDTLYFDGFHRAIAKRSSPSTSVDIDGLVAHRVPSRNGKEVYDFDGAGRHLRTVDGSTLSTLMSFSYEDFNGNPLLIAVRDADENLLLRVERSPGTGAPVALIGRSGARTEIALNETDRVSELTTPDGKSASFRYGETEATLGLLEQYTSVEGLEHTYAYDSANRLVRDESSEGRVVTLSREYTEAGYRVRLEKSGVIGPDTETATYELIRDDVTGDVTRVITPYGGAATYVTSYADGRREALYPDGSQISVSYASDPRLGVMAAYPSSMNMTTASGQSTLFSFTLDVEVDPDDSTKLESYDLGMNIAQGSEAGVDYAWAYTAADGNTLTTTPTGRTMVHRENSAGLTTSVQFDSDSRTMDFAWNDDRTLSSVVDGPWVQTRSYQNGKLVSLQNSGFDPVQYNYSGDQQTSTVLPSGLTWNFNYNANGLRDQIIPPSGDVHSFQYNSRSQVIGYTPPSLGGAADILSIAYDSEGRPFETSYPSGGTVTRTYDSDGRIQVWTAPDAEVNTTFYENSFEPDLMSWQNTSGTRTQTLDWSWDSWLVEGIAWSGDANGSFEYAYDRSFLLTEIAYEDDLQSRFDAIAINDDGEMTGESDFVFTLGGIASMVNRISDSSAYFDISFDEDALLPRERALYIDGNRVFASGLQINSENGLIEGGHEEIEGTTTTRSFTFDADGHLSRVTEGGAEVEAYAYDINGNRSSRTYEDENVSYTYDARDQLVTMGTDSFVFNADGKLAQAGSDTFDYGARGELHTATVDGNSASYTYDGWMRRSAITDADGTQQYMYGDVHRPLLMTHARDSDGVLTRYFYDSYGLLYAMERGGSRYYIGTDMQGTPKAVFDSDGTLVKQIRSDSFGRVVYDSNPGFALAIGFHGGLVDSHTGFVRFGMRDYDPRAGRFTTRDPAMFSSEAMHLFNYAGQDPIHRKDPTGADQVAFSAYAGPGGGVSFSWSDWMRDASICFEVGFGLGAGGGYTLGGEAARSGENLVVAAKAACAGMLGLGSEAVLDDCGRLRDKTTVDFAGTTYDITGDSVSWNQAVTPGVKMKAGKLNCKAQAKLSGQVCRQLW